MPAPDCPTRADLDSFQAGELDDVAQTSVASHVESCSKCQRSLETIIGDSSDTVLSALLAETVANPFAEEVACQSAIERVAQMAGEGLPHALEKELAPTIDLRTASGRANDLPLPLETIREYKLLAKLGEGGMGAVYRALHTRLDKVVALKVLPEGRIRDAGSVARFQREMKAVGRLDHPNIVRAMDAGEEAGTHFLVMEYVEGADLSGLAKSIGPLPVADACELVRQAAVGLQEAHEHGMVHRDIKPSNLILAKSPRKNSPPTLKILDLGLALLGEALSADQGLTSTGQMMGTIDYMAPEQGSDTHNVDIRADIYSLGATLYRLLTGTAPFSGAKFDTPVKKILALATKEPTAVETLRADVPPALAAIVNKMLAKAPAQRFDTPEELAEALAPFCQGANLAALLEDGNRAAQFKVSGEAPTHPQLSSPSVATAPTIDYSIKEKKQPRLASRLAFAGLGRKIPRSLAIAAACGGLALAVLLGVVFYLETLKGTIRIEINDPDIKVALDEKGATFQGVDKKHSVRVQAGSHGLTITRGDLTFHTDEFVLTKGENVRLSVKYLEGKVEVVDTVSGKLLGKGAISPAIPQVASTGWHGWPKDAPKPAIAPFNSKQARKHQEDWAAYLGVPVEYENSIKMKFVLIPPGEFMMGSTNAEIETALIAGEKNEYFKEHVRSELPRHKVTLTTPIYLAIHEVTQTQYRQVMAMNPSHFADSGPGKDAVANLNTQNHPVESLSWNDAAQFCARLSQEEKLKPSYLRNDDTVKILEGNGYRLPTEAEWEFACRAGTSTIYWTGDQIDSLSEASWNGSNSADRTHVVGTLKANPFGLFDVHGNVWEMVQDAYGSNYYDQFAGGAGIDPGGPHLKDPQRVIRGGDWSVRIPFLYRSSCRLSQPPTEHNYGVGVRVALSIEAVKKARANQKIKPATASTGWHGWPKDAPKPAIAPFDAKQARKNQEEWANYLGIPIEYENSLRMKFVLIPPGDFLMGSPAAEVNELLNAWDPNDKRGPVCLKSATPQHRVILTRPVYASVHEVTQKNYQAVMGNNPSVFANTGESKGLNEKVAGMDTADFAVDSVSWLDATEFCSALSRREKLQPCYERVENKVTLREANGYRLPSEAEWEFSCRAGSTTPYSFGDGNEDLLRAGWFGGNSGGRPHAIGELNANPFGLYDVHGNAWEWVQDWWEPNYQEPKKGEASINPQNEFVTGKSERVLRGGNWRGIASLCRSSFRDARDFWHRHQDYGFRVWLSTDAVKAAIAERAAKKPITGWHGWPADAPSPAIAPFTAEQAKKHQQEWAAYLKVDTEYENSLGMKFVLIPPGEFTMGSTEAEIEAALAVPGSNEWAKEFIRKESPPHKVVLTQPIYLAIHEVTQEQYQKVTGENPSYFSPTGAGKNDFGGADRTNCPVESIAWTDAANFCIKLCEREKLKPFYLPNGDVAVSENGAAYRLPTEAQWEFACRAGTATKYWTGDKGEDLAQAAWFKQNAKGLPQPVGTLKPNPFGLYDIHGNIWEWVHDWWEPSYYGQFKDKPAIDPSGPTSAGTVRMFRGGNWSFTASDCRSAGRAGRDPLPKLRSTGIGFRIALPVKTVRQSRSTAPSKSVLLFDDRTDAVDLSEVTYDGSHDLTIEGWFKTLEFGHCEFARFEPDGPVIFAMSKGKLGEIGAQWKDESGKDVYAVCVDKLRVGKWQHIALVYRRQKMLLLVDGEPIAESEVLTKPGVVKGLKITNALMELGGLRVSRKSRYTIPFQPERRFASDADTLALFYCDEGVGEVLKDSSGHDRHGKIVGAKWNTTASTAEQTSEPAAVDREVNGTVFPAYAAAPLHLVKQKEDFASVRAELDLLRKSSKQNYHVVILPTLGDYLPRAADYLRLLAEEWQQEAAFRKEPFDGERLVIILMAMNDQQLQIHFGPKLKDGLGLEGPPVTKELLVPHFLPYAKQGKLNEGLVSLLRGTEKWIAEREATKNEQPK